MSREVPNGWTTASIQELCKGGIFTDGDWIESKDQDPLGQIRLVQLADIGDGVFLDKSSRWINTEAAGRLNVTKLQSGDILLARMPDPIGRSCIFPLDTDAITAVDVCIIRPSRQTCEREWLVQALNSAQVRAEIAQHATGTTRQRVSRANLGNIRLFVPPLSEQRRIAEILSSVDETIQATQVVIEQTRKVRQGVLERLLTKGIGHTQFKQTEIGEIPSEWQCLQTIQITSKMDSGWSPDCEVDPAGEGEWAILKTSAVVWEGYRSGENKRLPDGLQPRPEIEVKAGDVLVTRAGPVERTGVVAFVDATPSKLMLSDKIIRIQTKADMCLPEFLSLSLSSPAVQLELVKRKSGMAMSQTNVSQKTLRDTFIPVPPIPEQGAIVEALRSVSDACSSAEKELASLTATKAALMSDLLTGRKRVSMDLPMAAE